MSDQEELAAAIMAELSRVIHELARMPAEWIDESALRDSKMVINRKLEEKGVIT